MKIVNILVLLSILLALAASQATAQGLPPIPQAFRGAVTVNGQPAPVGTQVEARGDNVNNPVADNPRTTAQAGWYGRPSQLDLAVSGNENLTDGTLLRFYVNDMRAECQPEGGAWGLTSPFASGTTTQLNLRLVSPVLRISKLNSTTARLSWDAVTGAVSYALYRSTTPYLTPADPPYQTVAGLSYDDVGALGNPSVNYFYLLKVVYDDGKGMASHRVGEFDFSLTPGS